MAKIKVKESEVTILSINENDYISLTDIAKHKSDDSFLVINHWMRNRNTIEYLGMWETIFNPNFKPTEFDRFKMEAGLNAFTLSPQKWTTSTGAIGIVTRAGRYGGTYAHKDIAFKFASWISVEFELYMVKEFQRLKEHEQSQLGWSAKRELAKFNKSEEELDGDILEGMYFCFKNMSVLKGRPSVLEHEVFKKIFKVSELLNMDEETRSKVLEKMTTERDLRNQMTYARKEAIEEGLAEGLERGLKEGSREKAMDIARNLKRMGMSVEDIVEAVGLEADIVQGI